MKNKDTVIGRVVRIIMQLCAIALLVATDVLIKNAVETHLRGRGRVIVIPGLFGLTYAKNTGAAFSLFSSSTSMLSVVTAVALMIGLILMIVIKKKALIFEICIPLLIAGGAGNLIDRITRGYVVDYIETLFMPFPIFNFADCLITCSCFAIIIYLLVDIILEFKRKKTVGETADE